MVANFLFISGINFFKRFLFRFLTHKKTNIICFEIRYQNGFPFFLIQVKFYTFIET